MISMSIGLLVSKRGQYLYKMKKRIIYFVTLNSHRLLFNKKTKIVMIILTTVIIFLISCSLQFINCSNEIGKLNQALINASDGETDFDVVTLNWNKLQSEVNINLDLFTSGLASQLDKILFKSNVSEKCQLGLHYLLDQAKLKKTWAVQTLNSWGHWPPSGTFLGTYTSFGSYEQCLTVNMVNSSFSTQYCSILIRPLLPYRPRFHNIMNSLPHFVSSKLIANDNVVDYFKTQAHWFYYIPLRVGICLTNHCSKHEINRMAQTVGLTGYLQGQVLNCEGKQAIEPEFTIYQIVATTFFIVIGTFSLIGTAIDFIFKSDQFGMKSARNIFIAFSLRKNLLSIMNTSISSRELQCLHGIRFITMSWIIFAHILSLSHYHGFSHINNYVNMNKPFLAFGLLNSSLSVDTFFLISGLLTSYVIWKVTHGDRSKLNPIMFIVCRYLRLTPLLVASICLILFLPYLGSGPIWHEYIDPIVNNCQSNWWINLLYLQSFVKADGICLLTSWWISVDMVLHILSLFIIIPLLISHKYGTILNITLISSATIVQAIISYARDYPPAILPTLPQVGEVVNEMSVLHFRKPLLHVPVFFIGLQLGYFLASQRFPKMSKIHVILGWIISLSALFTVLYLPYHLNIGGSWSKMMSTLFDCTNRVVWAIGVSWIIYACATDHGGPIGDFLCSPVFRPLAKITYSVYLTHALIVWSFMGSRKELLYTDTVTMIYLFIGHWTLSNILGLAMALLFESPFLNFQKMFADKVMPIQNKSKYVNNNNNNDNDVVDIKEWDREQGTQNGNTENRRLTPF